MDYKIIKKRENIKAGKPLRFYPYPRHAGKTTLRDLAKEIAQASSLTRGDVENVILNLMDVMAFHLKAGRSVQLDEFCTLRMSFLAEGSDTAEEVTHRKIKKMKFVFTPGKALRWEPKDVSFRKV